MVKVSLAAVWVAAAVVAAPSLSAQRSSVRVSPHETQQFEIDGSRITIEYGRPSKKGRAIWGGLVPWNRWWMPGADEATTITTTTAIQLGTLKVPAGQHTFYFMPQETTSQLIVSNETGQWHTVYHQDRDLGRVDVVMKKIDPIVEQMTFAIEPKTGGGGVLKLSWDDREYSVDVQILKQGFEP
jgi:DUF2911 family protein